MKLTSQKQILSEFWSQHPDASRKRGSDGDYLADTRVAFAEFVDALARDGSISESMACRVTLGGGR